MDQIGIYMIATNQYVYLFEKVAQRFENLLEDTANVRITLIVATDNAEYIHKATGNFRNIKVVTHDIPPYGWPEATILRYEILLKCSKFEEFAFCFYLDCDMYVHRLFVNEATQELQEGQVGMVKHPGFAIDCTFKGVLKALSDYKIIKSLITNFHKQKFSLGTWEHRQESSAYVAVKMRRNYVHGAFWFGRPQEFRQMCTILARHTQEDLKKGITAIWHDESHLNYYAANFPVKILDSRFSWVLKYRNIKHLTPFISSVVKDGSYR
jgi:hypothetical protein